jgi:hypothetical protein
MTPEELQNTVLKLRSDLESLSAQFYKNNFSTRQDFTKACNFATKLTVPRYTTLPTCEVGDVCEKDGKLHICSASNVWTVVGTQS